jgi:hypothetical protein
VEKSIFDCAIIVCNEEEIISKRTKRDCNQRFLVQQGFVTKEFLVDNEYITRSSLEEILDSKNYVTKDFLMQQNYATKDYVYDMFESFEKRIQHSFDERMRQIQAENRQYLETFIEYMDEKFNILLEKVDARIERIERFVGLAPL